MIVIKEVAELVNMLIFERVVHAGSDAAQRSMTFKSTKSCLFQEVEQFLFAVRVAG